MSKVVVDCLKTLLSKPNQFTPSKHDSDKEASKGSNQPKKVKESPGSSKTDDVHRLISVLPSRDKGYTPPQRKEKVHAEGNQSNVQGDNKENDKSPVNHVHVVTNPLYKHASYKNVTSGDLQGVNVGASTQGAQPSKEELEDKDHCKFHDLFNHPTEVFFASKDILQEKINKQILKCPGKVVNEELFPSMTFVNLNVTNLRALINDKEENQGSDQPNNSETSSGSSKAGDSHRLEIALPNQEEAFTAPPRRKDHVHMVNNPLYQPEDFEDEFGHRYQEVNTGVNARGAQTSKKESKGKCYCKYHNSFNHATKVCRGFKTMLQKKANNGIHKFPKERKIRKCWIPRGQMFEASARYNETRTRSFRHNQSRDDGESVAFGPRYQHFSRRAVSAKHSPWLSGESSQQSHEEHQINESLYFESHKAKDVRRISDGSQVNKVPLEKTYEHQVGRSRFVLPPRKDFDGTWRVAQHRKFSKPFTKSQKRRLPRERVAARIEELGKPENKPKLGLSVTGGNLSDQIDDLLSEENVKERKTFDFCVGKFHISVDCATGVVILPEKFELGKEELGESIHNGAVQKEYNNNKLSGGGLGVVIKEEHMDLPNKVINETPAS